MQEFMYYIAQKLHDQDGELEFYRVPKGGLYANDCWSSNKKDAMSFESKQLAHQYIEKNITGSFAVIKKNDEQADRLPLTSQFPAAPVKKVNV